MAKIIVTVEIEANVDAWAQACMDTRAKALSNIQRYLIQRGRDLVVGQTYLTVTHATATADEI